MRMRSGWRRRFTRALRRIGRCVRPDSAADSRSGSSVRGIRCIQRVYCAKKHEGMGLSREKQPKNQSLPEEIRRERAESARKGAEYMERGEWKNGMEKAVRGGRRCAGAADAAGCADKGKKSLRKKKTAAHPNRDRALRVLAAYPYRKAAVEAANDRCTADLERARHFVAVVEGALAVLAAEERSVLLDKTVPLADGTLPTGFDRYERAACEKSAYYRLRARALERFAIALYGRY